MERFAESIHALIVETATNLPPDVRRALQDARSREKRESRSTLALHMIAANVDMAQACQGPICQDTGLPTFEVKVPAGADELLLAERIGEAVAQATREGKLRRNAVDPVTGVSSPDNRGAGVPVVHFEQWLSDDIEVRLLLKGGGCENVSAQYSLPCTLPHVGRADRTLDGVRRAILHAVHQAQGKGCSPGVAGVAIGGDRATGYAHAMAQLFRGLDDVNPDPALACLEQDVLRESNGLAIGAMGFGGATTLLGCKIGGLHRVPASFFVSVAYGCWALRRLGVLLDGRTGAVKRWLYAEDGTPHMDASGPLPLTGREVRLRTPLSEAEVRGLRVGDMVLLSGLVHTGRDALHHYLVSHDSPVNLRGAALFHCGPVATETDGRWTVHAAGPTTSIREEPYQAELIRTFGLRAVIGKGGMGPRTLAALKDTGAVYLSAIGGAAQYYARCVESVDGVDFLAFGVPEAMWHLQVKDLPAIVTMDAHGESLHADVEESSAARLEETVGEAVG
jgi:fumarate hydratase class I